MSKGRHEAAKGGWRKEDDPFQEKKAPKAKLIARTEKNGSGGWSSLSGGKKAGIIAGCSLAAAVLMIAGWWMLFVKAPDVSENNRPGVTDNNPNTPAADGAQQGDGTAGSDPGTAVSGRKDDVFTFLLLGKDTGGGGNTDTMILVTYDVPNGTVDCVSIPRDTMINVTWSIKKINAVFASSRGIDGLKEEVGHLTGIVPDFYVAVEWEAIGKIVDALGGVEFDVPYNMNYDDPYQDLHIHQSKGLRKLTGEDAMQVIRWRKNNKSDGGFEVGDTGRRQIQQDFLKAVAKQCLQIGNWTKISQFAQIFFENVETDIKLENMLWFAQKAMGVDMENVTFYSLPGNDQGFYYTPSLGGNLSYFFADPAGIVELMNEHFNPYVRDITEKDLQIMYKNKDASLGVTNGTLASAKMAQPSVKPSGNSSKDPDPADEPANLPAGEPDLPDSEADTAPGTATDPGTEANPGTVTDPGSTTAPGTATDPGAVTDPGTSAGPGDTTEPGNTDNPGTAADPDTTLPPETVDTGNAVDSGTAAPPENNDPPPDPVPEPEPTPEPAPEPELPPEPVLPEE